MGSRYYLTGVQIGILQAYLNNNKFQEALKLLEDIEENQFIGLIENNDKLKVGFVKK